MSLDLLSRSIATLVERLCCVYAQAPLKKAELVMQGSKGAKRVLEIGLEKCAKDGVDHDLTHETHSPRPSKVPNPVMIKT